MSEQDTKDADMERVRKHVEDLAEHFDTVHVFVTRAGEGDDDQSTLNINIGTGNWFARLGFVKDWIIRQDEYTRQDCRDAD